MIAFELSDVHLVLDTARSKTLPGGTGTMTVQGPQGLPIEEYLARWAADPKAFPDGAVEVVHFAGHDYLTGDAALVNAIEGVRELTGLPIRPLPVNDEPTAQRLERADAVAVLARHGLIAA